jgi:multidrug efflux pump subunit AcrB
VATIAPEIQHIFKLTLGTLYVNSPVKIAMTDIKVNLDHDKAGLFGVAIVEAQRTVRMSLAGISAGKFRDDEGNEYDINVTSQRNGKATLEALDPHSHRFGNRRANSAAAVGELGVQIPP